MKLTVWMAEGGNGEFLCHGNPNEGLSYHFSYPYDSEYLRKGNYVICRTKWEVQNHIRKWHKEFYATECGRDKKFLPCQRRCKSKSRSCQWRCKAVKVVVTWEVVKGKR